MNKKILIDLYNQLKEESDIAHDHGQTDTEVSRNYYQGKRDGLHRAERLIALELNADLQSKGLQPRY